MVRLVEPWRAVVRHVFGPANTAFLLASTRCSPRGLGDHRAAASRDTRNEPRATTCAGRVPVGPRWSPATVSEMDSRALSPPGHAAEGQRRRAPRARTELTEHASRRSQHRPSASRLADHRSQHNGDQRDEAVRSATNADRSRHPRRQPGAQRPHDAGTAPGDQRDPAGHGFGFGSRAAWPPRAPVLDEGNFSLGDGAYRDTASRRRITLIAFT